MPNKMGKKLDIIKQRGSKGTLLPNSDALTKLMELSTTPEAAIYLRDNYEKVLNQAKVFANDAVQRVWSTVSAFADFVSGKSNDDPWSGKEPLTLFQSFQANLAKSAADVLSEKEVTFDYSLSDTADLLRAYSEGGELLNDDDIVAMDKLFNSWLVSKDYLSEGGVIYLSDKNGEVKEDSAGQPIRADASILKRQIEDDKTGFRAYVQERNESVQLSTRFHEAEKSEQATSEQVAPSTGGGSTHG
jgi:hypothetical protein